MALSGATRVYVIVGDPIAQVKAPAGMTAAFAVSGHDGVLVPMHVSPADFPQFLAAADRIANLDGIVATVPHKFASFAFCRSASPTARAIGAVNVLRRSPGGGWHGDMVDGIGFTAAMRGHGGTIRGVRALLVGAGGAGSAIGAALIEAGVASLALHDTDSARRDGLIDRLRSLGATPVTVGSHDPMGYDVVANATPLGMREGDPLPIAVDRLQKTTFVGCVVTAPPVTPLIAAARARGCATSTGSDMYLGLQAAMVDFFLRRNDFAEPGRGS